MTDYSKHKNILLQILKEIYLDTSLAPFLGFKGGTAAVLFFGLNRDSVDLDFDLLDEGREKMVFEKIQKIAVNHGRITDQHSKHFGLRVNRRNYGSRYELRTALGISMLVMVREDMFANKLMATYERMGKTSRDVYDVWFFLANHWPINKEIVESRAKMTFRKLVERCVKQLEKMNDRRILDGLGEFLTEAQKDWARAKLRTETVFLLRARLASEK